MTAPPSPPGPALVLYLPALHRGYRALLEAHPSAHLYVLDASIIQGFRALQKDLRALQPAQVLAAVQAWKLTASAQLADAQTLSQLPQHHAAIIMPDEDLSRQLARQYFPDHPVTYAPLFLRWDRRRSETQEAIRPDHTTHDPVHQALILQAATLSHHSSDTWRHVGAIITRDQKHLTEAHNHALPSPHTPWIDGDPRIQYQRGASLEASPFIHAEAAAIARAARQGLALEGADIYVTTFPCPTCAKLIATAGLRRCYYQDGYSVLDGQRILQSAGIQLIQVQVRRPPAPPDPTLIPYPD